MSNDDLKLIAGRITVLSKQIQDDLDVGLDVMNPVGELLKENVSLVFALGMASAPQQVKVAKIKNFKYYNVRDASGKFAKV